MKTAEKLLVHLAEHLRDHQHDARSLTLRLPIRGIDSLQELRRAVTEARARGYFTAVEEGLGGEFVAGLSDVGAEVFAPK